MNSFVFKPWVIKHLFPFLGGLLYPMGFPMKTLPHFMGFSFLGIFLLLQALPFSYGALNQKRQPSQDEKLKTSILSILLFSLGYCLVGYYWIPYTLKEFGNIPFPFNSLLGTLFSLIIVPQLLLFLLLYTFWNKLGWRKSSLAGGVTTRNLSFSLLLVILENITPQQFPAHIGHTWLQLSPYLGLSPIFGVPAFSFFSYWLIFSFVSYWRVGKWDIPALIFSLLFLSANLLMPLQQEDQKETPTINVRLVQANIGNFIKTNAEKGGLSSLTKVYERYKELSNQPSEIFPNQIDLIIWPETAYPNLLNSSMMRVSPAFVPTIVRESARRQRSQLFFGGYDKSGNENENFFETEYNASFFINKDGTLNDVYHKKLLIPFGESLPFGPLNPFIGKFIDNLAFFAKGERFTLFELDKGPSFISAICYEILFSGFIREYLNETKKEAWFIVNLTNDSWYGKTSEPYQHKYLAHWRALEFQIPIIRMTNTGISSILYPDGRESQQIGLFEKDILDKKFSPPPRKATTYQKYGMLPFLALALLIFLICWGWEQLRGNKFKNEI